MTKKEEQIRRIVDMHFIFDVSFRPLDDDRWEGAFMDTEGHHVNRTEGESIEEVLDFLDNDAREYKFMKRREKSMEQK